MNLFDLFATLKFDGSDFEKGVRNAEKSASQLSRNLETSFSGFSKGISNFGKGIENIGSAIETFGNNITKVGQAASVVTAGVGAVLTATFSKAKTFIGTYESAMVVFRRKLQGGEEEAKNMYNELVRIAKGSAYAQEHMISAGKTLVAMGNDFNKTSKYVQAATDAVAAFGGTGTDVEELAHRFGRMSQQTTLYTMDLNMLVDQGVPAWDILATKYRTTTDEVKKLAKKGLLPAKEGLEILTDAMEETNEQSEMFKYSVAGMAKALKSGTLTGVLDSLNTSFRTFSLTLLQLDPREKTGIENIKKLNTAITKIGATLENIGKKLGNIVGKDLSNMFDRVSNALDNFNNRLDDMKPEQIEKLVHAIEAVAIAGPALLIVGKIISSLGASIKAIGGLISWLGGQIGTISGLFVKLVVACGGVAPAFGIIAAAGTAIISIAVAIKRHWETVVKFFKSFKFGQTLDSIKKSAEKLIPKIKKLGDFFEVLGVAILAVLSPFIALGTYIVKVFMGAVDGAIAALGGLIDILSGFGNIIVGIFSGDAGKIQEGFNNIWEGCVDIAEGFVKTLLGIFDPLGLLPDIFDPAISSTIEFSDTVSEESQKAVQAYMNLDRDATIALNSLYWSSKEITDDTKKEICGKYDSMCNYIIQKIEEQKNKTLKVLQDMVNESETLNEDEKNSIIETTKKQFEEREKATTEANKRINEILSKASEERRQLTEEEKSEIGRLQEEMKNNAVAAISESQKEQLAILTDLRKNAEKLSAEECSEVVKQSIKQKDETVKNAKDAYRERLKVAEDLRRDGTEESKKTADKIIEEADRLKKESIKKAEETHNQVVSEAQKQAKEHGEEINTETGEILSKWDKFSKDIVKTLDDTFGIHAPKSVTDFSVETRKEITQWCDDTGRDINQWDDNMLHEFLTFKANASGAVSSWREDTEKDVFGWSEATTIDISDWNKDTCDAVLNAVNTTSGQILSWSDETGGEISNWASDAETDTATAWDNMESKVDEKTGDISSDMSSEFGNIGKDTEKKWDAIEDSMETSMSDAKKDMGKTIDKIKDLFNFQISWPHIPTPQFKINPSGWKLGDLLQGSIPSLDISWHAKGGIFTKPTLFPTAHGLEGVGEAGAEAVLPIKVLREYIVDAMAEGVRESQVSYKDSYNGKANAGLVNGLISAIGAEDKETTINLVVDGRTLAEVMYNPMSRLIQQKGAALNA